MGKCYYRGGTRGWWPVLSPAVRWARRFIRYQHAMGVRTLALVLVATPAAATSITDLTTCEACVGYRIATEIWIATEVYAPAALYPSGDAAGLFATAYDGPLGEYRQAPGPATFHLLTLGEFIAQPRRPDLHMVYGLRPAASPSTAVPDAGSSALLLLTAVGLLGFAVRRTL